MRRFTSKLHRVAALLCALLFCVAAWAPTVAAAPLAEGSAGALQWSLNNGTLSIRGEGAIPNYTEHNPAPWHAHRESVLRLVLADGVTAVGNMAFYECAALTTVNLPDSVTTVGASAFAGCEALETVRMPRVQEIGNYAFSRCFSLSNVTLPDTLTAIGGYAFYRCTALTYIRVPSAVTSVGSSAFAYCSALLRADITAPLSALPEWCFYGCERLQVLMVPASATAAGDDAFTRCDALATVYHGGSDEARRQFSDAVSQSLPDFTVSQMAPTAATPPTVVDKETVIEGDHMEETTTQLKEQGDTLIRVEQTITTPVKDGVASGDPTDFESTVHATVNGEQGWQTVLDEIREQINQRDSFASDYGEQEAVRTEITLQSDLPLMGDWLSQLAGRDVVVTIVSPDGSRFTTNGKDIAGYTFEKSYSLGYTLTPAYDLSEAGKNVVGSATCYWLSFHSAFAFPVTVEVLLDPYAVHQIATIYEQIPNESLLKLQTAMLDSRGYAAFRMAVVNQTTRYLLALNVAGTPNHEVVRPEGEDVIDFAPLDDRYSFSEVRGFLGLTMGEFTNVMLIAGGAFLAVVLLVVAVIVILGKRKAKIAAIRAEVMGEKTPADSEELE